MSNVCDFEIRYCVSFAFKSFYVVSCGCWQSKRERVKGRRGIFMQDNRESFASLVSFHFIFCPAYWKT